jgi:hypothetical protein
MAKDKMKACELREIHRQERKARVCFPLSVQGPIALKSYFGMVAIKLNEHESTSLKPGANFRWEGRALLQVFLLGGYGPFAFGFLRRHTGGVQASLLPASFASGVVAIYLRPPLRWFHRHSSIGGFLLPLLLSAIAGGQVLGV